MFFWNSHAFSVIHWLLAIWPIWPEVSLSIWKFSVHVLLKPSLENFDHHFASMWSECNCVVVWALFDIALLWDWNENLPFLVLWLLLSSTFSNFLSCWDLLLAAFKYAIQCCYQVIMLLLTVLELNLSYNWKFVSFDHFHLTPLSLPLATTKNRTTCSSFFLFFFFWVFFSF